MIHKTDDKPLSYWVSRIFPNAEIRETKYGKQIMRAGNELSPALPEEELLIWLDGVNAAINTWIVK